MNTTTSPSAIFAAWPRGIRNCRGLHEFVVFAAGIGRLETGQRVHGHVRRAAIDEEIVGLRNPIPALVAIHGVVATDDRRNARTAMLRAYAVHERKRGGGTARRGIAAVQECVDENPGYARSGSQGDKCGDLPFMTMDATRGEQSQHVQR